METDRPSLENAVPIKPTGRVRKLLSLTLLAGIALIAMFHFREPRYQGKSASYWLDHMDSTTNTEIALSAFKTFGRSGVLFLLNVMKEKQSGLGEDLVERLSRSNVPVPDSVRSAVQNQPSQIERRNNASRMLSLLGPNVEPGLPDLMREFNEMAKSGQVLPDWDVIQALEAVGDAKARYIPDFVDALRNNWEPTAMAGAILLGSIGPKARATVPVLLEQMPSGSWQFSNVVAEAVWKIDRRTNLALQVFTNELLTVRNTDKEVPLRSLRDMGPAAGSVAPLVLQQITNFDDRIRAAAGRTLQAIDPFLYQTVIGQINQRAAINIKQLIDTVEGTNNRARVRAIWMLGTYGHDAKGAVPTLVRLLQSRGNGAQTSSGPPLYVQDAMDTLSDIGPDARDAVPTLVALLRSGKRWDYDTVVACRALGNIGGDAAAALPPLKKILSSDTTPPLQRLAAALAITRIDRQETGIAPIVIALTNSADSGLNEEFKREMTIYGKAILWNLGIEKTPPLAEIMALNPFLAIPLLGDIGPAAKSALPFLENILDTSDEFHSRNMAARAIRKIDVQEAAALHLPGLLGLP